MTGSSFHHDSERVDIERDAPGKRVNINKPHVAKRQIGSMHKGLIRAQDAWRIVLLAPVLLVELLYS